MSATFAVHQSNIDWLCQRFTKVPSTSIEEAPGLEGVSNCCRIALPHIKTLVLAVLQAYSYGANFLPAATESEKNLAQPSHCSTILAVFGLQEAISVAFDVTSSIQARQITPKLQGYHDKLARTFPALGCLARPNAKCAPDGSYCCYMVRVLDAQPPVTQKHALVLRTLTNNYIQRMRIIPEAADG